jgi:hypothetical protein
MSEGRMRGRRGGGDRGDRGEHGDRRRAPRGAQQGIPDPPEAPAAGTLLDTGAGEVAVADVVLPADADLDAPLPASAPGQAEHRPVDLNSLYRMTNQELLTAAQRLNVENASSMRKQDLIFEVMKAPPRTADHRRGRAQVLRTGTASCAHPTTTTCPAPTTSTSPPRRSSASASSPATPSPGRCARPRTRRTTSR